MDRVSLILSALVSGANAIDRDFGTEELRQHFDYLSAIVNKSVQVNLDQEAKLLAASYKQNPSDWRDAVGSALTRSTIITRSSVMNAAKAIVSNLPDQLVALVRYPGDPEVPPPPLPSVPSRPRKKRKQVSAE